LTAGIVSSGHQSSVGNPRFAEARGVGRDGCSALAWRPSASPAAARNSEARQLISGLMDHRMIHQAAACSSGTEGRGAV